MYKLIMLLVLSLSFNVNAQSCKLSCEDELKLYKREVSKLKKKVRQLEIEVASKQTAVVIHPPLEKTITVVEESSKNIISFELVKSQSGLHTSRNGNIVEVEPEITSTFGIMYQRQTRKDIYLGIGADMNSGLRLNLGLGF